MTKPISVLIADDHPLILMGMASLIGTMPELTLLGQASTGLQAVACYEQLHPDVVLMDLNMPELNGIDATKRILSIDSNAKIIILTTYLGEEDIYRGMAAGARAYMLKDAGVDQLKKCIQTVATGCSFLTEQVRAKLSERVDSNQLSKRELDILGHLSSGKSNKLIARCAGIEIGTVKFHVKNILQKLNVATRTEAVTVAARRGLLSPFDLAVYGNQAVRAVQ